MSMQPTRYEHEWEEQRDEADRLRAELLVDRAVCICGCPTGEHENYGEDGEACGDESHQCMRVAPAVAEHVADLHQQVASLTQERDRLKEWERVLVAAQEKRLAAMSDDHTGLQAALREASRLREQAEALLHSRDEEIARLTAENRTLRNHAVALAECVEAKNSYVQLLSTKLEAAEQAQETLKAALRDLLSAHDGYRHNLGPCICAAHERARELLSASSTEPQQQP